MLSLDKVYKRSVIEKISFQQGKKFEDIYYMTDLSKVIKNFAFIDYPLIDYRERQGSIIQTLDKKYVDDYLGAFLYRIEKFQSKLTSDKEFENYLYYKTFNRFAGLVKKIEKNANLETLNYVDEKYKNIFNQLFDKIPTSIGFLRYQKLKIKKTNISKILAKVKK